MATLISNLQALSDTLKAAFSGSTVVFDELHSKDENTSYPIIEIAFNKIETANLAACERQEATISVVYTGQAVNDRATLAGLQEKLDLESSIREALYTWQNAQMVAVRNITSKIFTDETGARGDSLLSKVVAGVDFHLLYKSI